MGLLRFHCDFFGPDALPTAVHFLKHLDQFCAKEGVEGYRHWTIDQKIRAVAVLECDEGHLPLIRERLRPKRAERVL